MTPEQLADLLERVRDHIARTAGSVRTAEGYSAHLLAAECGTAAYIVTAHAVHFDRTLPEVTP